MTHDMKGYFRFNTRLVAEEVFVYIISTFRPFRYVLIGKMSSGTKYELEKKWAITISLIMHILGIIKQIISNNLTLLATI